MSPLTFKPAAGRLARPAAGPLLAMAVMLSACSPGIDELQGWMEQQRREAKPNVTPLEPPKPYQPEPYRAESAVDPFSTQKLTVALRMEARQPNSLLAGELTRRKEPLEAFPLDSMRMVGSVERGGRPFALLRINELLYQVKVGDYLGQNYGRVTRIDETEVVLREIVQDAAGEWIERSASLQLQEGAR